ncbi:DUF4221 family protein [Algoriphagus aestuarii]|nr:DUF4221 family protein [Algoriphagus aestuarii]
MKKLLLFTFSISLFSCSEYKNSESGSSNLLENFSFTVDTVVIDPGEEILAISNEYQLKNSTSFSNDNQILYILNYDEISISKVDLNQLRLLEVFDFEKEGPNGTGVYVQRQQVLPDEDFLITAYESTGIFDREGNRLKHFKLNTDEFSGLDPDTQFSNQLFMSSDANWLFSFTGFSNQGAKDLVKLNPDEKSGQLIDLPALDIADDFLVSLHSDQGSMFSIPQMNLQEINGVLYITCEVTSSIYKYDYQKDTLQLFTFDHQLVPNAKSGKLKSEVSSRAEFSAEMSKSSSQISFEKLLWDDKTNRFLRLGRKIHPKEDGSNTYTAEVFLFVYDKDLNLLGETLLEELDKNPAFYFFKDGKLWSYVNVEDELGFAVFTFDF